MSLKERTLYKAFGPRLAKCDEAFLRLFRHRQNFSSILDCRRIIDLNELSHRQRRMFVEKLTVGGTQFFIETFESDENFQFLFDVRLWWQFSDFEVSIELFQLLPQSSGLESITTNSIMVQAVTFNSLWVLFNNK
jgi:hypothetical protein